MKEILRDRTYLWLQGLSIAAALLYLLSTNTYHNTLIFLSWLSVLGLFLACTIRSAMKKGWMMTSLNLAMVILFFMSLMVLPYRI